MASDEWTAIAKKLRENINEVTKREEMKLIGEFAAEQIRVRTRLGYGVTGNDHAREKLPALSKKYIERRKRGKGKEGGISEDTSPSKSNLTFTSQMLDSIEPITITTGSVTIGPQGTRKDGLTNAEIAGYVSDKRPFFYVTDLEYKKILDFIRLKLGKLLERK